MELCFSDARDCIPGERGWFSAIRGPVSPCLIASKPRIMSTRASGSDGSQVMLSFSSGSNRQYQPFCFATLKARPVIRWGHEDWHHIRLVFARKILYAMSMNSMARIIAALLFVGSAVIPMTASSASSGRCTSCARASALQDSAQRRNKTRLSAGAPVPVHRQAFRRLPRLREGPYQATGVWPRRFAGKYAVADSRRRESEGQGRASAVRRPMRTKGNGEPSGVKGFSLSLHWLTFRRAPARGRLQNVEPEYPILAHSGFERGPDTGALVEVRDIATQGGWDVRLGDELNGFKAEGS